MKLVCLLSLALLPAMPICAQNDESAPAPAVKSVDEVKAIIGASYARNPITSVTVPYHFAATFQTFDAKGQPDGEGTIERWAASRLRTKTVTKFRDHTMTEYYNNGPFQYTDDGYVGNIMSYFASVSLFYPVLPVDKRGVEPSVISLDGDLLDCGAVVLEIGPPNYPAPPKDRFCVSRSTGDLALRRTENVTFRYQDFASFLDKSIARTILGSKGSQIRFRVKIEQLDQATLDDASMNPPPNASPTHPEPNVFATQGDESTPIKTPKVPVPPELKTSHASGQVVLYVLISRTGAVTDIEPIFASTPELSRYAEEIARGYIYKPIIRNGRAIQDVAHAYFTFRF